MNRIFINGTDITKDIKEFDDFDIEIGLNTSTKSINKILSQEVTVTGETYEYLKNYFYSTCDSLERKVSATFKTDICGGISIPLIIGVEGMENFPEGDEPEMIVTLKSDTEEDRAHAKLDSDLWFDNGFPDAYTIPIVFYADQPNVLSWVIIILTTPIRIMLNAIDSLIESVCEIVTLGFGKCDSKITGAVFSKLDTWLTGLGRWSVAPLVREILTFQCQQAGLQFSSSILLEPSSPYYNMGMFVLETGAKGSHRDTSTAKRKSVLLDNAKIWTVIDLLENLKIPFEADYRIIKGVLYFEKVGYFDELANDRLFHVKDKCTEKVGYSFNTKDNVAHGEFSFTQDAYDTEGNKMINYYKQRLEFNDPYSPAQKGKLTRFAQFGTPRFMFDQLSFDKTGFFDWESVIDEFRDGPDTFIAGFFDNEGLIRKFDLILAGNMISVPKLLIFENNFNRNDAMVIKKPFQKRGGKQYWMYNFPLMYKESLDRYIGDNELIEGTRGGLTNEFAVTTNPRLKKDKMKVNELEIDCDCDVVTKLVNNFQTCYMQTHYGKGIPENATISFKKNKVSVSFKSIRVLCAE